MLMKTVGDVALAFGDGALESMADECSLFVYKCDACDETHIGFCNGSYRAQVKIPSAQLEEFIKKLRNPDSLEAIGPLIAAMYIDEPGQNSTTH